MQMPNNGADAMRAPSGNNMTGVPLNDAATGSRMHPALEGLGRQRAVMVPNRPPAWAVLAGAVGIPETPGSPGWRMESALRGWATRPDDDLVIPKESCPQVQKDLGPPAVEAGILGTRRI